MNHVRTAQQPVINSWSEKHLRTLFDCTMSNPQIISKCKCFFQSKRSSFSWTGRALTKTMTARLITHWVWQPPRVWYGGREKSSRRFSATWSKLDQTTHRGCNYDQPAGLFLHIGRAATRGPQLLTCHKVKSAGSSEVPDRNTWRYTTGRKVKGVATFITSWKRWCLLCPYLNCNTEVIMWRKYDPSKHLGVF